MSTIIELMKETFTRVGVFRNSFAVARHFFDIHINDDGIAGYFVWKRNDFRIPIYHHLKDRMMRNNRDKLSREEVVNSDERNFFIAYADIQGLVTDREHKVVEILYPQEQINFYYRSLDDYDQFVSYLKENVPDKYFTRDNVKIEDSVYIS